MKYLLGSLDELCKKLEFSFDETVDEKDGLRYVNGVNVGKIDKGKYLWNINLFRLVADAKNVLKLDKKKAFLFVCGRDVLDKKGIENKYYFVYDNDDNFLGIAVFNGKVFKNKLNIGIFIDNSFGKDLV